MLSQNAIEYTIKGRDLPWLIEQWNQRTPHKTCLIWASPQGESQEQSWTYQQFGDAVKSVAGGLQAEGYRQGQRLLFFMDNSPAFLMSYLACAYLGLVPVLINTKTVSRELRYYCDLTAATGAIVQRNYLPVLSAANVELARLTVVGDDSEALVDSPKNCGQLTNFQRLLQGPSLTSLRPADPHADLRIQFTSGTTSRPKAVLSTHANSLFAAQQVAMAYGLTADDICQVFVPLFHNNGLSTLVTSTLWSGGTIVLQAKFSASKFWSVATRHRATWSCLPGSFFINTLWSQPVPPHQFRQWIAPALPGVKDKFQLQPRNHWGMTEMITLPLVTDCHHPDPPLSLGRPSAGIEISLRHDDGSECEPGDTGHLFVRGVRGISLFKEYVNNPAANRAAFDKDGWFDTGDRLQMDDQGNLFFADRSKDMLRVGGENVAASEIEAVIKQLQWVRECAVVGQKHTLLDEVPVAFISIDKTAVDLETVEQTVIECCKSQLAEFKVVRSVHIVDEFPRASLQKIAKYQLAQGLPTIDPNGDICV